MLVRSTNSVKLGLNSGWSQHFLPLFNLVPVLATFSVDGLLVFLLVR